jgi:transcriptional regulator with XRE-family HTH domain
MEFKEWFYQKFIDDAVQRKSRPNISDLARRLGTSQPGVSRWLNGDGLPDEANVRRIAKLFGMEVYEILGIQRPTTLVKALYFSPRDPTKITQEEIKRYFRQGSSLVANIQDEKERESTYINFLASHGIEHISTHVEEKYDDDELESLIADLSDDERDEVTRLIKDRQHRKQKGDQIENASKPDSATVNSPIRS